MNLETDFPSSEASEVLCKKGVLKNFTKFTGKHLCWGLFLKTFIKNEALTFLTKFLTPIL